jgi:hypothetical protein
VFLLLDLTTKEEQRKKEAKPHPANSTRLASTPHHLNLAFPDQLPFGPLIFSIYLKYSKLLKLI